MRHIGKLFLASEQNFTALYLKKAGAELFPLVRDSKGNKSVYCVSPQHGRSFLVDENHGRYIVLKGSGLTYTNKSFYDSGEFNGHAWGVLNQKDALRDYLVGCEIEKSGIKTNCMEAVMLLDKPFISQKQELKCCLLQYSVECPYRISDFPFISMDDIRNEVEKWKWLTNNTFSYKHLYAADVMFRNLKIMHSSEILHNAIHSQNYTWALELLDFELSRTPTFPYENENKEEFKLLYKREILYTWEIINNIAWIIGENMDEEKVEAIANSYDIVL